MGKRNEEERIYHAAKEREYRVRKNKERQDLLDAFIAAGTYLTQKHNFTVGKLVDELLKKESVN